MFKQGKYAQVLSSPPNEQMLVLDLETQNWLGIVKNNVLNVFDIYIQVFILDSYGIWCHSIDQWRNTSTYTYFSDPVS